jgi:hypothetical protein
MLPIKFTNFFFIALIICFTTCLYAKNLSMKTALNSKNAQSLKPNTKSSSTTKISSADKELIVRCHNKLRNDVALQLTKYKLPKASNMRQVYWDEEIAKKAQDHANKKVFNHSSSTYRKTKVFSYLGENLYSSSSSGTPVVDWDRAINKWYNEIANYPKVSSSPKYISSGSGGEIGHFTQVIWAETYAIGCGVSTMSKGSLLYVCEYGPGGNVRDKTIYQAGNLNCPSGTSKSSEFAGLCCLPNKCTSKQYLLK